MKRAFPLLVLCACNRPDPDEPPDTSPAAAIVVSPGEVDLGVVFVGEHAQAVLGVENAGDAPVTLVVEIAPPDEAWSAGLPDDAPAPGDAVDVYVTFAPDAWGAHAATLVVRDANGGGRVEVPLAAEVQEDADGDGLGSTRSGGDDCDDADPEVYPGARDPWYDGVDGDCGGEDDYDRDADGVLWPFDCDDGDASVGAPADEAWNGRDDDCDGAIDELSVDTAAATDLRGGAAGLGLGGPGTLALGGDVDGDGVDDLIVAAPAATGGAAWLLSGSGMIGAAGPVDVYARARFVGSATLPLAGVQGRMADLTGDATADVLLGATSGSSGAGLLLDGDAAVGEVALAAGPSARFVGSPMSDTVRWAAAGDLDGDGVAEVVTGAVLDTWTSGWSSAWYTGSVAVFAGGDFSGEHALDDADALVHGAAAYDYLGASLALGDLTGDGYADVVAGAPGHDGGASGGGVVYVLPGGAGLGWADERADGAAALAVVGARAGAGLGAEPLPTPGDLDGDGLGDLVLGASDLGAAWAFRALVGASGRIGVDAADLTWSGETFATAIAVGDLDADGIADVAIGAAGDDTVAVDAGAVYLFVGGESVGARTGDDADAVLYGHAAGDALGAGLAAGGDLDGDGAGELLVGAPGVDAGAEDAGAVYALRGR